MFKYFIYVWDDILCYKFKYLVFLIQMIFVILILNVVISIFIEWYEFGQKISELKKNINLTSYAEDINDSEFVNSGKSGYDEFYQYTMEITEGKAFSFMSGELELESVNVNKNFRIKTSDDKKLYPVLYISAYIQEYYGWNVIDGRMLTNEDIEYEGEYIPVILGYDYAEYYKVNDIFEDKYKVIGILEEDSFYLNPRWQGKVYNLDKTIMIPMNYGTVGWGGAFLNQLNVLTEDQDVLNKITIKAFEEGLQEVTFRKMTDQLIYINNDMAVKIKIYLGIAFILLIMCIASEVSTLLNIIESRKKEFIIHIMCGAEKKDIYIRIGLQIFIILLISSILSCFIFTEFLNWILTLVCISIIAVIVLAVPLYRLHKQTIAEMLKRKE